MMMHHTHTHMSGPGLLLFGTTHYITAYMLDLSYWYIRLEVNLSPSGGVGGI